MYLKTSNKILRARIPKPLTEAYQIKCKKGRPWQSTVIFIDQYGNHHKLNIACFRRDKRLRV
jgi:hypothetical protein